jgi:hypothetical protein
MSVVFLVRELGFVGSKAIIGDVPKRPATASLVSGLMKLLP